MLAIPAIDLWEGRVVRFLKGNPAASTVYSDNPLEIAKTWKEKGAKLIHLVDLSAALGQEDNFKIIVRILKEVDVKIEVGGGIRDVERAKKLISLGAHRVIVGTKSLEDKFLKKLIRLIGVERIAVSVDAVGSVVAVKGWQEKTSLKVLDFIESLLGKGIKWIIYTDISRDGTLKGVNLDFVKKLSIFSAKPVYHGRGGFLSGRTKEVPSNLSRPMSGVPGKGANIIIAGGVASLDDINKIKRETPLVWGVIIGKALYEGKIDLENINMVDIL